MPLPPRLQKLNASQRHALDASRNLVIRANAGSGKTSVLIERIVQILARNRTAPKPLGVIDIAAITFTRKAAAELQERLRKAFGKERDAASDPAEKAFWASASRHLSRAMIGTIDSLCGRILREFHWELRGSAHIELDFETLDRYDQQLLQQEAIDRVINRAGAAASDSLERAAVEWWARREGLAELTRHLLTLLDHSVEPDRIVAAHAGAGSIEDRCRGVREQHPGIRLLQESRQLLADDLKAILDVLGNKPRTKTLQQLREDVASLLDRFADADQDDAILGNLANILLTAKREPKSLKNYKDVEPQLRALQETWADALSDEPPDLPGEAHAMQAADHLALLLGVVHAEYLTLCRQANRYDFLTVARRTRDLLKSSRAACEALKRRYRYLMIDEFQDTNPLQWEILTYVVGDGPDGFLDHDRLCIVGDPQQSIFRFRQADVRVFQQAHEKIIASNQHHGVAAAPMLFDGESDRRASTSAEREGFVALAENYRSLSPLPLLLMDEVFEHTFDPVKHGLDPAADSFEIHYQRLEAGLAAKGGGELRYVYVEQEDEADEQGGDSGEETSGQPGDLVAAQVEAVAGELANLWGGPRLLRNDSEPTTLRWRDMAILLPSRTETLTALEKALRQRHIPFTVFGGIGFWQRQETRDLVSLASWLADPGDELSLFVVLRSPIVNLNDSENFFLSQLGRGGLWRGLQMISQASDSLPSTAELPKKSRRPEPSGLDQALDETWRQFAPDRQAALRELAPRLTRWRERTDRMEHADVLQRALEESGAYALYAVLPEGEQILANLRQFFDRVRGEEARSALGLARLARRLRAQVDDSENEGQANLASTDDAVQIMTVHAAKGLEFPVVAVLKMEAAVVWGGGPSLMVQDQEQGDAPAGTIYLSVRHPARPLRTFTCQGLRRLRELDKRQQIAEKRRLFYVAGTRASERLILAGRSLHKSRRVCWQSWFEEALGLEDQHRQAGVWEHPTHGWRVQIVQACSRAAIPAVPNSVPAAPPIDLEPIAEGPFAPTVAATQVESLRQALNGDPQKWNLSYRWRLNSAPPAANSGLGTCALSPRERGALVGQLVHRLLMFGDGAINSNSRDFDQRLRALAAALLERGAATEEIIGLADTNRELEALSAAARRILGRLRQPDPAAAAVRQLMSAPGKTEVPFAFAAGRWIIRGRFDKLVAADGASGYALVDWKTGHGSLADAARRYHPQMQLYALALARAGLAARSDSGILVQLVFLETAEIFSTQFCDEELRAFGLDLENDLLKTEALGSSLEAAGRAVPCKNDGG